MKVEFVNPFVDAAISVLHDMCGIPVKRGELSVKKDTIRTQGVAPLIGVTGQVSGRVIYDMTTETAIKLASAMNMEELPEFNDLAQSTINELANIISGSSINELSKNGYNVDITPPTLFMGKDVQIAKVPGNSQMLTLVVPLHTDSGDIFVNVALQESK